MALLLITYDRCLKKVVPAGKRRAWRCRKGKRTVTGKSSIGPILPLHRILLRPSAHSCHDKGRSTAVPCSTVHTHIVLVSRIHGARADILAARCETGVCEDDTVSDEVLFFRAVMPWDLRISSQYPLTVQAALSQKSTRHAWLRQKAPLRRALWQAGFWQR